MGLDLPSRQWTAESYANARSVNQLNMSRNINILHFKTEVQKDAYFGHLDKKTVFKHQTIDLGYMRSQQIMSDLMDRLKHPTRALSSWSKGRSMNILGAGTRCCQRLCGHIVFRVTDPSRRHHTIWSMVKTLCYHGRSRPDQGVLSFRMIYRLNSMQPWWAIMWKILRS